MARKRRAKSRRHRFARRRSGERLVPRTNPRRRRRRYFGNPGGTILTTLKSGVKDGAIILVAQVITKKAIDLIAPRIPLPGIAGVIVTGLGIPALIAIAGRKALPSQSRLVTAAAFAEGVRRIVAATPAGPFLSDVIDADAMSQEYSAWPAAQIPANIGAYPGGLSGAEEMAYAD